LLGELQLENRGQALRNIFKKVASHK
jgi:hypothetical protein